MRPIVLLLIVLALGAAGVTVFLLQRYMATQEAQQQAASTQAPVGTSEVLVAARDLTPGTVLTPEDTRWIRWPNESIDGERMVVRPEQVESGQQADPQLDFNDRIVRRSVMAGEPMTREMVIKQGDGSVTSANIAPGMRAVTLTVTPATGVAGLVLPGDRVDVVMNASVRDLAQLEGWKDVIVRYTSETIMKDVRVVAINQKLSHNTREEGVASPGNLVTLEVEPKEVERLLVAQQLGALTLTLRSLVPGLKDQDKTQSYTMDIRASKALSSLVALDLGQEEDEMPADIETAVKMAKERAKKRSEVKVNRGGTVAVQKFGQ